MRRIVQMSLMGVFAVFLSGCGEGLVESIGESIANGMFHNGDSYNIPDGGVAVESDINVTSNIISLTKVTLIIGVTHEDCSDLSFSIESPLGTSIILSENNGNHSSGCSFTLVDSAIDAIENEFGSIDGDYRPEQLLSNFNDENPNGIWKLFVHDTVAGGTGNLKEWYLLIEGDK